MFLEFVKDILRNFSDKSRNIMQASQTPGLRKIDHVTMIRRVTTRLMFIGKNGARPLLKKWRQIRSSIAAYVQRTFQAADKDDPVMQCWTAHLDGGPRRVNHAAVAVGLRIYSFGGYCTGENYEVTRPMDIHILDTVSLRWHSIPVPEQNDPQYSETPYQRYGHTAVSFEEYVYIWGGRNDNEGASNILHQFDTNTLKWSRPKIHGDSPEAEGTRLNDIYRDIPGARDGHSACVIKRRMYIFGGYEENREQFSQDIHYFDFDTMTWHWCQTKGAPARWRDFHSATGFGEHMIVFGGRGDLAGPIHTQHEIYDNRVQMYNTDTSTWYEPAATGTIPPGRRSHSAFVYGEYLYIFGGYNGNFDMHFRDMFQYDPVRMVWSKFKVRGQGPCARRRQCCCVVGNKLYLFGGTSPCPPGSKQTSDIDLIDLSDLHVLDFEPTLKSLCQMAVIKYKHDWSCLPRDLRWELQAMTTDSTISRPLASG